MSTDQFGNAYASGLPYARGQILTSTEDDFHKFQESWRHIAARVRTGGPEAIYNFSGLEHGLPLSPDELPIANDFVAPALYFDQFKQDALEHCGGSPEQHDVALFNRLTGATYATHLALVKPGDVVIGVSASYSHASVVRAVAQAGATLIVYACERRRVGQGIALVLTGRWPRSCVNPSGLEKTNLVRWQPYSMGRGPGA